MKTGVSVYLDLIRGIAAIEVFLAHFGYPKFGDTLQILKPYAHLAVIAFFVISGYVIAYVSSEKESDIVSYSISRATRIYSVAIPALIITAGIDIFCKQKVLCTFHISLRNHGNISRFFWFLEPTGGFSAKMLFQTHLIGPCLTRFGTMRSSPLICTLQGKNAFSCAERSSCWLVRDRGYSCQSGFPGCGSIIFMLIRHGLVVMLQKQEQYGG